MDRKVFKPMKRKLLVVLCMAAVPLALFSASALSGDGVTVNITNDGTEAILVTVYDTTVGPHAVVLSSTRINGFTTVPLSVTSDASGLGNISWTAVTADANDRKCGHADSVGLGDSAAVTVSADSACKVAATTASAT